MKQKETRSWLKTLVWVVFIGFTVWWLYINVLLRVSDHNSLHNQVFTDTYGIVALLGGVIGIIASKKWGGSRSLVGRSLLFFSIGLLLQEFGQIAYSFYYYVLNNQGPYPSFADVGYFGSVLVYIYASWQLAKASGINFALKARSKKMLAILLPLIVLVVSYMFFLRDYQFDFSTAKASLTVFLDFGYPLGQAIYIAIALVTYLLSNKMLGGVMRNKILLVLAALCVQYAADFSFLYANQKGTFFAAGANDYVYLLAYTVMALALSTFRTSLPAPAPAKTGVA